MAHELPIARDRQEVSDYIDTLEQVKSPLLLTDLPGGFLEFTDAVYSGVERNDIYARKFDRGPQGLGAHWDVYDDRINPERSWVGVFNIAGTSAVAATFLESDLAEAYDKRYPKPTADAREARRHFSALAFGSPYADIFHGVLTPSTGIVLPQKIAGPDVVHEITPDNEAEPGQYIKIIVPRAEVRAEFENDGYMRLDEFVTSSIGMAVKREREMSDTEVNARAWVDALREPVPTERPSSRRARLGRSQRGGRSDSGGSTLYD